MKALKTMFLIGATGLVLVAAPALAQTPPTQPPSAKPPAQQPPTQQPPAQQTPPATQLPATQAQPPKPFPEGARIGYVNVQFIVANSVEGKASSARLEDLKKKKTAELAEKNKKLQELQNKLQQGGTVMNEQARSQLEKDIDRTNREIQFFQQDANSELQDLNNELMADFQKKLNPILEQVATEKGLHMVFNAYESGLVWAHSGLDLSAEVVKRFDATAKAPVKKEP
jgi:outer membrane protein